MHWSILVRIKWNTFAEIYLFQICTWKAEETRFICCFHCPHLLYTGKTLTLKKQFEKTLNISPQNYLTVKGKIPNQRFMAWILLSGNTQGDEHLYCPLRTCLPARPCPLWCNGDARWGGKIMEQTDELLNAAPIQGSHQTTNGVTVLRSISWQKYFFPCLLFLFVCFNKQAKFKERQSLLWNVLSACTSIFNYKTPNCVVLQTLLFSPYHVFFNIYYFNTGKTTLLVIWSLHAVAKTDRIHVKLILCFLVYLFAFPKLCSSWVSEEQEQIWSGVYLIQPRSFGFDPCPS